MWFGSGYVDGFVTYGLRGIVFKLLRHMKYRCISHESITV